MDTNPEPTDWRRAAYETTFRVRTPTMVLQSVCLACSRHCQYMYGMDPYIRRRVAGNNKCDCYKSTKCMCRWSFVRAGFDRIAAKEDGCIGPNQVGNYLFNDTHSMGDVL
jgi:hypothetical protein